ncbi:MAG: DUF3365 domain-containing protein [Planctomycetales bacterium]
MRLSSGTVSCSIVALAGMLCAAAALFAEPPLESKKESTAAENADSADRWDDEKRVSVESARERARLAHNIYATTLDVIHHRYFRNERSTIPARAMEDVFSQIARQENIKGRWIAVNAKAMSIDHKPRDDFEKQAAKAIAAGSEDYERVENGVYRRAKGISLMNRGCLICHLGFGASGKTQRFAGLVITIPVDKDARLPE